MRPGCAGQTSRATGSKLPFNTEGLSGSDHG